MRPTTTDPAGNAASAAERLARYGAPGLADAQEVLVEILSYAQRCPPAFRRAAAGMAVLMGCPNNAADMPPHGATRLALRRRPRFMHHEGMAHHA